MSVDDLAGEDSDDFEDLGLSFSEFRNEMFGALFGIGARELAHYFINADKARKKVYEEYVNTQAEDYQTEFRQHLTDPLLGDDDYGLGDVAFV